MNAPFLPFPFSPLLAAIDGWIFGFSAVTVIATIWMGFRAAGKSKTASDFFVAGRSVSVGWNASAISGEYLSAASFMGIAGMVMSSGYDSLWYPVCYACGYLFLLLFIAGPLRRFGAYTIPDFAEGRFDSPVFRKIAVIFVLFIGFFYTMPQMKGAGTTLAYIFPGLPYWAGVVLVGAVITFNVALGGMKGITLVQAFQYWLKMFAISVPIFVLMAVYGHYGKQVGYNASRHDLHNIGVPAEKLFWSTNFPSSEPKIATTFVAQRMREFTDAYTKSFLQRAKNSAIDLKDRIAQGGVVHDRNFVWQFKEERAPEMIQKWFWIRGLAAEPTPDYVLYSADLLLKSITPEAHEGLTNAAASKFIELQFERNGVNLRIEQPGVLLLFSTNTSEASISAAVSELQKQIGFRAPLPAKAPSDTAWLNPFGPLTTKAAKVAAAAMTINPSTIPLRANLPADEHMTVNLDNPALPQILAIYGELTGRELEPRTNNVAERLDEMLGGKLTQWKLVSEKPATDSGVRVHRDGMLTAAEVKKAIETHLQTNGLALVPVGTKGFQVEKLESANRGEAAAKAWLTKYEKPLALLYTYSLIIAIVCGTAGLPHILVRFYTNPNGVAAKRTTMWVMILIGVFYVFPPVFGALGRNLLPDLYAGVGAKGTDKIVLELPRILNDKYAPLGSILSGITCAGAFAAFMSTFSGLLVSMTGALAHDVYGRMLRPNATAQQRMRMFKIAAVLIGGVSVMGGTFVEPFQINFMVGQAFAIAAASYFPLLFMAVWWRKLTMKGAAVGMLGGGVSAVLAISLTSFSDLKWVDLSAFWAANPLARILCEQPAIWAVPLALVLMVVVSLLTSKQVPSDIRMKMLVLHAPEELGLKQEYIQEHQAH